MSVLKTRTWKYAIVVLTLSSVVIAFGQSNEADDGMDEVSEETPTGAPNAAASEAMVFATAYVTRLHKLEHLKDDEHRQHEAFEYAGHVLEGFFDTRRSVQSTDKG